MEESSDEAGPSRRTFGGSSVWSDHSYAKTPQVRLQRIKGNWVAQQRNQHNTESELSDCSTPSVPRRLVTPPRQPWNRSSQSPYSKQVDTSEGELTEQTVEKNLQKLAQLPQISIDRLPLKKRKADRIVTREEEGRLLQTGSSSDVSSGIMDRVSSLLRSSTVSTASMNTVGSGSKDTEQTMKDTDREVTAGQNEQTDQPPTTTSTINSKIVSRGQTAGEYVETDVLPIKQEPTETRASRPRPLVFNLANSTVGMEREKQTHTATADWMTDNPPDEPHRLEQARSLLARTEEALLWTHPNQESRLPNVWGHSTRSIHKKVKHQVKINLAEYNHTYTYSGHMGSMLSDIHTKQEISKATLVRGNMPDVGNTNLMDSQWEIPILNGPRIPGFLCLDSTWKTHLKGVIIGLEELVFQPEELQNNYLNLSEFYTPSYPVRLDFENLTEDDILQSGLYRNLYQKLELIDRSSTLPVLIEFAASDHMGTWRDDSIGSFLKVIQHLQRQHSGPVIVVTASPVYKFGETPASYMDRKAKSVKTARSLNCLGRALGVPTAFLWLSGLPCRNGEYHAEGTKWLPLFTETGQPTPEYNRRLSQKIASLLSIFEGKYTSGQERRCQVARC